PLTGPESVSASQECAAEAPRAGRRGHPYADAGEEPDGADQGGAGLLRGGRHPVSFAQKGRSQSSATAPPRRAGPKSTLRRLLAETCGWFTEGFDTQDLKEAKALLDELS